MDNIAKFILKFMGWSSDLPNLLIESMNKKGIYVFSHTSNFDGLIFLLYYLAHPDFRNNVYAVAKPQLFNIPLLSDLLDKLGFIKSTAIEDAGKGLVDNLVDKFSNKKSFTLLLSPKGKRDKGLWKSGYYWVAKKLNCKVIPIGLDYQDKQIKIFKGIKPSSYDIDYVENYLKNKLGNINPLYPDCSEYKLKEFHKNTNIISTSFKIMYIVIFILILYIIYKYF